MFYANPQIYSTLMARIFDGRLRVHYGQASVESLDSDGVYPVSWRN